VEPKVKSDFTVYPNPSNGTVRIEYVQDTEISILDISGKVTEVFPSSHFHNSSMEVSIDLSHLKAGIYFVKMQSEEIQKVSSIVLLDE